VRLLSYVILHAGDLLLRFLALARANARGLGLLSRKRDLPSPLRAQCLNCEIDCTICNQLHFAALPSYTDHGQRANDTRLIVLVKSRRELRARN
jgi:hypothetical protein